MQIRSQWEWITQPSLREDPIVSSELAGDANDAAIGTQPVLVKRKPLHVVRKSPPIVRKPCS